MKNRRRNPEYSRPPEPLNIHWFGVLAYFVTMFSFGWFLAYVAGKAGFFTI